MAIEEIGHIDHRQNEDFRDKTRTFSCILKQLPVVRFLSTTHLFWLNCSQAIGLSKHFINDC